MLHSLYLSLGFGAPVSRATCASSDEVNAVSALVQETKAEATAAKAQASVAPQGSADYPGLFALAENSSTIHLIAGMKKMGLVTPSDWECQSQARTGVYPCPDGEPSECRYYQDPMLANWGECVYWYCTKDPRSAGDGCCKYYDGRIGASLASSLLNLTFTDGSSQTLTFAAYAETSGAAATCSATADQLHSSLWHQYWYNDNSVQSNGQLVVTTAYINFDIVRLEFSHKYGLSLYSTNQDILKIEKDGQASCSGPAAPNSCYTTYFQPIQSSTVIYLQNGLGPTVPMSFSLDESELYNSPPAAPGRRMEEGGDAPTAKPNPVTVEDVEEMNRATRFIASCDGNKPGCSGGKKFASGSHTPPVARHGRMTQGRRGGGGIPGSVYFNMLGGGSANRAGNGR